MLLPDTRLGPTLGDVRYSRRLCCYEVESESQLEAYGDAKLLSGAVRGQLRYHLRARYAVPGTDECCAGSTRAVGDVRRSESMPCRMR
eukprot:729765-Rhodomonas_salina.2